MKPAQLVRHADQKHRLFRVLEHIDDAVRLIFQIDIFAIGDQMDIAVVCYRVAQPPSHFLLEKTQDPANFLQRKTFAAQLGDHRNFHHFLLQVDPPVPLLPGRDNVPFVPPLQLPEADAGDTRNIPARIAVLFRLGDGRIFSCFEHFAVPLYSCRSTLNSTRFGIPGKKVRTSDHVNIRS